MVSHFLYFFYLDAGYPDESVAAIRACHPGAARHRLAFYTGAYKALRNKSANMDVLVALGTTAAYAYSLYMTIASLGRDGHAEGLYYETSAILLTLILLGKLLEMKAKGRSSEAIKS